jgi:hypothetical protein
MLEEKATSSSSPTSATDEEPALAKIDVNETTTQMGLSPLKIVRKSQRIQYGKRKLQSIQAAMTSKVASVLDVPTTSVDPATRTPECKNCEDLDKLVELIKKKLDEVPLREKVKILTLTPDSWSIEKTASEFNVTKYIVKKARKLKKEQGILAEPEVKKGKTISSDIEENVKLFYQNDEVSRMFPGKKDYVSVKINGKHVHMQKRLLLANLKELHLEYLKRTGDKIGFSKFCELRPKWCVTVASPGSQSVCVCQYHQNAKLMASVIPDIKSYRDLLEKMVCNIEDKTCMIHYCDSCPGVQGLKEFVGNKMLIDEGDMETEIEYKKWITSGKTTL